MSRLIPFRLYDDRTRGPLVNVSFTLDGESVDLLWAHGKNRSRTVRRAIKHFCQERNPTPEMVKKYNEVCIERKELREKILDLETKLDRMTRPSLLDRIKARLFVRR